MQTTSRCVHVAALAAITLLSTTPVALAWGMLGSHEPDTAADASGGWMFPASDVSADQSVRKVYFNGFYGQCVDEVDCYGLNPNVASVGSSVHTAEYQELAVLGVWKDCNKDGFVGDGDQGLWEYRTTLLLDSSTCPPTTQGLPTKQAGIYPVTTIMPPHNDGTWVHELIPIQWYDQESNIGDHNPYNINDDGARVWMDHAKEPGVGLDCFYTSWPSGTFRSTGGMLSTFDCLDSYHVTDTADQLATGPLASLSFHPCASSAPAGETDCAHDQSHSTSKLNQRNPWGEERSFEGEGPDGSYASVWDCNQQQLNGNWEESTFHTDETTGPAANFYEGASPDSPGGNSLVHTSHSNGYNVSRPAVPPAAHPVAPSVSTSTAPGPIVDDHGYSLAGTANETGRGFDECTYDSSGAGNTHAHEGQALGGIAYSESGTSNPPYRTEPDDTLSPIEFNRPVAPQSVAPGYGQWGPPNEGVQQVQPSCYIAVCICICGEDGFWTGNRVWHQETVLTGPSGPAPVVYETYYAYVSPSAISAYNLWLPKAGSGGVAPTPGTFGQEACQGATTGIVNGWDCNAADWYKDAAGADTSPRSYYLGPDPARQAAGFRCIEYGSSGCNQYGARPGDPYDMLDIDCYDQSVQAARPTVQWGVLTGTACT